MGFLGIGRRSITASASIVTPDRPITVQRAAAAFRPWQNHACFLYDRLAEVHYPANFSGSALSRFGFHIATRPENDPTAEPFIPEQNKKSELFRMAEEALASLGDIHDHAKMYGINKLVAADCWLYGENVAGGMEWEILSIRELHANDLGELTRYPVGMNSTGIPTDEKLPDPSQYQLIRMWNKHPFASQLADGPLNPLKDDCDRLIALNDSITSRLLSRLSQAGILFLPNGLQIAGEQTQPDGTNQPKDPFFRAILNTMEKAILNRSSAAGSIPIMVRGPSGEGEKIVHIKLDREIDRVEMELRSELRSTIATGMDLPSEVQTGLGGASHWSAWSIVDSTLENHLIPSADQFAADLKKTYLYSATRAIFRLTTGRDFGPAEEAEMKRIFIYADPSQVRTRPNVTQDAIDLSDRVAISPRALRQRAGVIEDDAPSDAEYIQGLGRKFSDPYLATWGMKEQDQIDWSKVSTRQPGAPGPGGQGVEPDSKQPTAPGDGIGSPDSGDAGKSNRGIQNSARIASDLAAELRAQYPGTKESDLFEMVLGVLSAAGT